MDERSRLQRLLPDRDPPSAEEEPEIAAALALALEPERARFEGAEPGPLPDPFVATPPEQEMGRLEDRISELRVEAARTAEERQELADRLAATRAELDEARCRITELEALVARHEQRVLEAYQRLQAEDRLRQKARRALGIGLRLLDAGAVAPAAPAADQGAELGFTDQEPESTPK